MIPSSRTGKWSLATIMILLLVVWTIGVYRIKMKQQTAIAMLTSIHPQDVTSFKIHSERTYTKNYQNALEVLKENKLVMAFFQAITDSSPYHPAHDQALAQWGMQIRTDMTSVRISCHIPDHKTGIVAGTIFSDSGSGNFQSTGLLKS